MKRRDFLAGSASRVLGAGALNLAPALMPSGHAATARIVLVESQSTRQFFDAQLGKYEGILAIWRAFAARHKLVLESLPGDQIKSLRAGTVAILPSLVALSDREREDLEAAAQRGVNLLATWAFAPRDSGGKWVGYGLMKKLFDAEVASDVKSDGDERFLLTYAESPISYSLPPAKRVFLGKVAEPLLRALTAHPAARYGDWVRSVHKETADHAAVAYYETANSRRIWLGPPETCWETARAEIDLLLLDCLNWLQRKPAAVIANWPAPYQSAFLLEMDTEDKFQNALLFEDELSKRGLRGTFYCLTEQAVKFPEVVKRLGQKHEIAFHADTHVGFKGQDPAVQQARMQKMFQDLSRLVADPKQLTGFRAPLEEFDAATEIALRKLGIRHHATSPDFADIALPLFSRSEPGLSTEEALVLLPRTMLDDVNFFRMGLLEKSVSGLLLNTAKSVIDARAFGLLSLHTQNYGADSALQRDVPKLLDFLAARKDRVWMASGDQLERWWRQRNRLSAVVNTSGHQLDIRLTVNTPGQVRLAQMVIFSPAINQVPKVQSTLATTLKQLDDQRHALIFPELNAGNFSIKVSFGA